MQPQSTQPQQSDDAAPQLTSTTAPGKIFGSRAELAQHYKSQWHKYNLKRREAGLPPLLETDFEARLQAAQEALEAQQQQHAKTAHLKKDKKKQHKKKQQQTRNNNNNNQLDNDGVSMVSEVPAYNRMKEGKETKEMPETKDAIVADADKNNSTEATETPPLSVEEQVQSARESVDIDPRRCLFDRHLSATVQDNVARMHRKYGFFVPDVEYLVDVTGLIGYCHEKIAVGRVCLYCQKTFGSGQACQKHMVATRHTKLRYEAGVDLDEFAVFYDFGDANREFLATTVVGVERDDEDEDGKMDNSSDDEWEDVSDDDEEAGDDDDNAVDEEMEEDDEDIYAGYEQEVAAMGLDVTPLGELVFPDGRIIGHRAFRRYYKQRAPRQQDNRASVQAARHAAGDRLYQGRVVNIHNDNNNTEETTLSTAAVARQAGIKPSLLQGRVGKGILVAQGNAGSGPAYTQLSIYRYRAALRKERRGQVKGQKLHNRTNMNINRMDKKHNRLMNGVSVAHAAR